MSQPPSIDELRAQVSRLLDSLDPQTPIAATVVFQVARAKEGAFVRNADALAEATRRLPGCKVFGYHKHKSFQREPGPTEAMEYLIYEEWETVRLFRAQWDSTHLRHFQDTVGELLAGPPDLRFYQDVADVSAMARVLETGQKRCWDSRGVLIDCSGSGQDGEFQIGVPWPTPRFLDNGDGTVTDNLTGLIWLKDANSFGEVPWEQALENARNLASGSCELHDDSRQGQWRLPNVNELQSLMALDNSAGVAFPTGHPFTNLQAANYWSSSSVASFPALSWYVALAVGPPVFDLKFNAMRMWPVRGESTRVAKTGQKQCWDSMGKSIPGTGSGQDGELQAGVPWPTPRFLDNGDGTVTDNLTELIWLKNATPFGTRNWEQALMDCNSLASGRYGLTDGSMAGEWRLPDVNELRSLVDYNNFAPTLPGGHPFTNVRQSLCWSSTTVASATNLARFLFVGIGSCVWDHKSVFMGVWPVRGGV